MTAPGPINLRHPVAEEARPVTDGPQDTRGSALRPAPARPAPSAVALAVPGAARLLGGAVLFGLGSAAFWTFAVDHVHDAGGLDATTARVMLGIAGVGSLLGAAAGDVVHRIGARATSAVFALLAAAAVGTIALAPTHPPAVFAAALAFGASCNAVVAVQAIGSGTLFPDRPSTGLSLAMGANAAGLLWGPLTGGALTDAVGLRAALLGAASLLAATALLAPRATGTAPRSLAP